MQYIIFYFVSTNGKRDLKTTYFIDLIFKFFYAGHSCSLPEFTPLYPAKNNVTILNFLKILQMNVHFGQIFQN